MDHLLPRDAALDRLKTLHARAIDLSLGRIERLLEALGRPQDRLPPTIHVAGTNGKGSTVAFLRAMAEAQGLRVHAFTSPHLVRFAERIRLAGEVIGEDALAALLDRVEAANAGEAITFFEITTAAALLTFSEVPADLLLLEVGLGGTWDATNVIASPLASVIAPVDYDHAEFLGTELAGIAAEKAGIIKAGRPVFSAGQALEAQGVIVARAAELGAPLTLGGRDWRAWSEGDGMVVQDNGGRLSLPAPALGGPHQVQNAGLAIATLRGLGLADEAAIARGLNSATWPARMQRITAGPLGAMAQEAGAELWLDGGHNPHAGRALGAALAEMSRDGRPLSLIVGMLGSKDASGFFAPLAALRAPVWTVSFEAERTTPPPELAATARAAGLDAQPAESVQAALAAALAGGATRVVICGSLYLAGEVLARDEATWPR